jgi:hypothetical protein
MNTEHKPNRKLIMDEHDKLTPDPRRRNFLRAAGGAGALATLAAVAGESHATVAATPAPVAAAAAAEPAGYHETEHIRQYYRTARYW